MGCRKITISWANLLWFYEPKERGDTFYAIFSKTSCFQFYTSAPTVPRSQNAITSFIISEGIKSSEREQQRDCVKAIDGKINLKVSKGREENHGLKINKIKNL